MTETLKNISELEKTDWETEKTIETLERYIALNPVPELLNYLRFFKELGEDYSASKVAFIPKGIRTIIRKHAKRGLCHENSMGARGLFNNELDYYYGFVDTCIIGYTERKSYQGTHQHSFLVDRRNDANIIIDVTISKLNMTSRTEYLHAGKNYFGVRFPNSVIERLTKPEGGEKTYKNISYYLKEFVFLDDQRTTDLINEIKTAQD
ncbi:MAG: hypothetical protein JWM20_440 [Patescibacteria group bacterium]|nr:hypothetical protein [Patescibacteria group bacterium]